jgi:hypothetical protein
MEYVLLLDALACLVGQLDYEVFELEMKRKKKRLHRAADLYQLIGRSRVMIMEEKE